ncbi:hypothetical protein Acr_13g0016000 [Actinidia rufa]|uniref:Uncharacterized protein n=1 Tax=Actinidia rufa TaxID=165716 RepID=A0A7J0FNH7_9ERIC|nr:hypothetical protein Acr_13g0016000 [Actinidia rufa]
MEIDSDFIARSRRTRTLRRRSRRVECQRPSGLEVVSAAAEIDLGLGQGRVEEEGSSGIMEVYCGKIKRLY